MNKLSSLSRKEKFTAGTIPFRRVLGFLAILSGLIPVASADTTESTWNGTSTTWSSSSPGSWNNGVPSSSISAVFNSSFSNQPTISTSATAQGIWVTGSGTTGNAGTVTIGNSGAALTITGNATLNSVANAGILLDGSGNNNLTINTSVTTTDATNFIVNNAGTLTINGLLTLAGSSATLQLGNSSTDTSSSVITITGGTATGSGQLLINTKGTVNLSGTFNNTSSGTGHNTVQAGTVDVTGSILGNGLTVTNGQLNVNTGGSIGAGSLTVNGTGTATVNATNGVTGAAAVTVDAGFLNLNASNNYTGTTTLGTSSATTGTTSIGNSGALGTGTVVFAGGTLMGSSSVSGVGNALVINSSEGGTIGGSNALSFTGTLTLAGAANRTLTVNNAAGTTLNAINITSSTSTAARTLTINGTGAVSVTGLVADGSNSGSSLTYSGTGTLSLGDTSNSYSGGTTLSSGGLSLGASGVLGTGTLTVSGGTLLSSTDLSGANAVGNEVALTGNGTIGGTSNLTLSGAITNSGGNHTLTISNSANTVLSGGNIYLSESSTAGRVLTINGTGGLTIGDTIANFNGAGAAGGLIYSGTGTLALNGPNTYTGATTVSGGVVATASLATEGASGGTASGVGASSNAATNLVLNGGTLQYTGAAANTDRLFTIGATTAGATGTLDASGTGAIDFTNTGAIAYGTAGQTRGLVLTGTNSGANTLASVIGNNNTSGIVSLTKNGSGSWIISGANTYTGATTVNNGLLTISGSTASGSAVSVNGGTLNVTGNVAGTVNVSSGATLSGNGNGTTTGVIGGLTLAGGGIINTQDTTIGTLAGTTLTLNTGGGNAVLDLDISSSHTADLLTFSGAASLNNDFMVNVDALSGASTGTYTIVTANGGGLSSTDFTAGTLTGLNGDSMTFQLNGNSIQLVITSSGVVNTYYFTGSNSGSFTDAGNYFTQASGGSQQGTALSSTSDVFLNATSPTPAHTPDTLNNSASINALTFVSSGGSLAGTGTLTLKGTADGTVTDGLADSATGGTTETVNPQIALGASQSWTVSSSSNTLAVAGGITGSSGQTLTLNGPGTFNFSAPASGAFSTTVSSGNLLLTNGSGSALGTGSFTLARGATFGGSGSATGLSSFVLGSGASGTAQVQVGSGGNDTTTSLTLTATGASTINNANLTFNLSSTTLGQANVLNLGATPVSFLYGNTTLTLNITGGSIIKADTAYVLITDTNGFSGLTTTGPNDVITGGLSIAGSTFFGASSNGYTTGFYDGSYLFLADGGTEIDVEVVPEPGTWALMLGGVTFLVFWQRRKQRS